MDEDTGNVVTKASPWMRVLRWNVTTTAAGTDDAGMRSAQQLSSWLEA